jgi:hypothetical protein
VFGGTSALKLIDFMTRGKLYLGGSTFVVFDLSSTGGAGAYFQGIPQLSAGDTDYSLFAGKAPGIYLQGSNDKYLIGGCFVPIYAYQGSYNLTLVGSFGALDFTGFSGQLRFTSSGISSYNGSVLFSSTMSYLISSGPASLNLNMQNLTSPPAINFNIPSSLGTLSFGVGITNIYSNTNILSNINSTSSFSASGTSTILQCNSISASSISINNTLFQPPISGGTTTFNSSGSISVTGSGSDTTSPIEFIATGASGTFSSSFRQTNLTITGGGTYTIGTSSKYNNINASTATLNGGSASSIYGNTDVYYIQYPSFTPDVGTTKTVTIRNSTNGFDSFSIGSYSDIEIDVDGYFTGTIFTQRGTLRLLSDCISTYTSSGGYLTTYSGTLDLNGRTIQSGRFGGGPGTLNFGSGGTVRIPTVGYDLYNTSQWQGLYTNVTGLGNVQFTSSGSGVVFITIGNNSDYSRVNFELSSTSTSTSYTCYLYGNNTINNIKNMNTVKKNISFLNFDTSIIGFNNLQLSDMTIQGNPGNSRQAYFKYTGTDYINLSNSSISWINALQSSSPNKFIALTSNRNVDSGNNDGIIFNYKYDSKFLQMF